MIRPQRGSRAEWQFERLLIAHEIRGYAREYSFHPQRRCRFDFAWPAFLVAVEIEGGIYVAGRHNRPVGYAADCEKYNAATLMGWRVLRCPATPTTEMSRLVLELPALIGSPHQNVEQLGCAEALP